MKKRETIITSKYPTTTDEAYTIMKTERVKKLPVLNEDKTLCGMFVWNDVRSDEEKEKEKEREREREREKEKEREKERGRVNEIERTSDSSSHITI